MFRRSTPARAFSLIEMLVVLAIVLVLLTLLLVPLFDQAYRAAYAATCASNLHEIGLAKAAFDADRPDRELEAGNWNMLLENYLDGQQKVLICPEDDPALGSIEGKMQLALWYRRLGGAPSIKNCHAFSDLDEGGFRIKKVSEWQVASGMRLPNQHENFYSANPDYTGYEPGDTPHAWRYWYNHDGANSGDRDYNDTLIHVSIHNDVATIDAWTEQAMINAGYYTWLVRRDNHQDILQDHPETMEAGNIPPKWIQHQMPLHMSSYGMNWRTPELRKAGKAKIFAIDYERTIVRPETWDQWMDESAVPLFARHPARMLNALQVDGRVVTTDPWTIDPQLLENEMNYWTP